jgi:hypothetical protein
VPVLDEHVRAVGREVRELARLHGELARTEMLEGGLRVAVGIFLFAVGVTIGGLALAAVGFALYLLLARTLTTPGAAAIVALCFFALTILMWLLAWHILRGSRGLTLPRTRQMLWELLQWRDDRTNS